MTPRETSASALLSNKAHRPATEWSVVRVPESGFWYDWANPDAGKVGQCKRGDDGWIQAPPDGAVIFAWEAPL